MATFENMDLADQMRRILDNFRRCLHKNAAAYTADIDAGRRTMDDAAAVIAADGTNMIRIIAEVKRITDDPAKKDLVLDGLAVYGISGATALAAITEIRDAAVLMRDNTITTRAQWDGAMAWIAANVTVHEDILG